MAMLLLQDRVLFGNLYNSKILLTTAQEVSSILF